MQPQVPHKLLAWHSDLSWTFRTLMHMADTEHMPAGGCCSSG